MMSFMEVTEKELSKNLNQEEFFVFNNKYVKALAFLHGLKNDYVDKMKDLLRSSGFRYDYIYDCYIKTSNNRLNNAEYRVQKDDFINKIINWKLLTN